MRLPQYVHKGQLPALHLTLPQSELLSAMQIGMQLVCTELGVRVMTGQATSMPSLTMHGVADAPVGVSVGVAPSRGGGGVATAAEGWQDPHCIASTLFCRTGGTGRAGCTAGLLTVAYGLTYGRTAALLAALL